MRPTYTASDILSPGNCWVKLEFPRNNFGELFCLTLLRHQSRGLFTDGKLYIHTYVCTYLHTAHALSRRGSKDLRYSSEISTLYQNSLVMRNTADVTGGKPIAVWSQSISGVSAINPWAAFYDMHGRKGEVLFIYAVPDNTQELVCFLIYLDKPAVILLCIHTS
jgi:hypothetical protein